MWLLGGGRGRGHAEKKGARRNESQATETSSYTKAMIAIGFAQRHTFNALELFASTMQCGGLLSDGPMNSSHEIVRKLVNVGEMYSCLCVK